ncbi:hypothetical protein DIJ64_14235 [Mycobacterium leprae]|uniref:Uncharacterized protein n=1 Tax=Mycobacterium leprae TaxID=1769 RepID=A0AAD2JDX6_MYCLR|nr:hypothetical protein DIJ64_14235 [Mycobacterium leprae]OAR21048.1 hypothetical protein A8144_07755 [Mycobacterium leprae 3125609]OAX71242.1 hypothetical protein A3216_07150 [Mycobacterium leprae 7935681]
MCRHAYTNLVHAPDCGVEPFKHGKGRVSGEAPPADRVPVDDIRHHSKVVTWGEACATSFHELPSNLGLRGAAFWRSAPDHYEFATNAPAVHRRDRWRAAINGGVKHDTRHGQPGT